MIWRAEGATSNVEYALQVAFDNNVRRHEFPSKRIVTHTDRWLVHIRDLLEWCPSKADEDFNHVSIMRTPNRGRYAASDFVELITPLCLQLRDSGTVKKDESEKRESMYSFIVLISSLFQLQVHGSQF